MKKLFATLAISAFSAGMAQAGPVVWAVEASATGSATSSNAYAEQFSTDGAKLGQVLLGTGFSPAGIAVVGTTAYVSASTDGVIRTFNTLSGVAGPSITTGLQALGSLSWDGAGFWANDYGGGNKAFRITTSGTVDRTLTLARCGSYCNGIEAFTRQGVSYLIANRGESEASATYDLYNANTGAAVSGASGLLAAVPNGSGVAYSDDTFLVANSLDNTLLRYSFAGALLSTATFGGVAPDSGFGEFRFVSDLAVVPEPMSLALLAAGLGALGLVRRPRR